MSDYQVAIPSHNRAERLMQATYPTLTKRGVPADRITVFVPDEAQASAYRAAGLPAEVRVAYGHGVGIREVRNAIADHYPVGTRLVCLDDDVTDLSRAADAKTLQPVEDVDEFIRDCFTAAPNRLWCVYPVSNPYFMRPKVRRGGLWFAGGWLFGYRVRGLPHVERVALGLKEDYERSCRFYLNDGEVIRFDAYAAKTRYQAEPGGLQDFRTEDGEREGAFALHRMFPDLAHPYQRKDGRWEIRLRDKGGR